MKTCSKCFKEKPLTEFHQYKTGPRAGKYWAHCKECRYDKLRKWRKDNPEEYKKHYQKARYKFVYGLNEEDVKRVGECPLCLKENTKLVVDHCHTSGKVRGFICYSCNTLLGHLENDEKIRHCLDYLLKHNSPSVVLTYWDGPT